jgi:lipopolysaccharide transport system permease protein
MQGYNSKHDFAAERPSLLMHRLIDLRANAQALKLLWRNVMQYRELLWEMTRRDLLERQAGLTFGAFWVVGQPLLMMLVYVFVFSFIFKVRLNGVSGPSYTAFLLAGLVPWLAFQEALGRAPTCIPEHQSLVKQIVFPVEILPLKLVLSTLVVLGVGLIFPLAITLFDRTAKPLFWLLLPIPILSHLLLTGGLVYIIAAAGVFLRDIRNIIQLFLMMGLFVHPILYAPGTVPKWTAMAFQALPFSHVIWIYRDVVMGRIEHPASWLIAPALGIASVMIGYRTFQFGRHMFGDAL